MAKSPRQSEASVALEALRKSLKDFEAVLHQLSPHAARKARAALDDIRRDLDRTAVRLDPIREPAFQFDPTQPDAVGRFVVLALLAQPRVPLEKIARSYGAGVYAIYYRGKHPYYTPISGSETPIYVGKADPKTSSARTAREQGDQLFKRLQDHRKVIMRAENYVNVAPLSPALRISDFECRRLVTATNAQLVAEKHLINLFHPVWNWDEGVCWGISKHGDTEGRNNDRSPWHVVHPTEYWASQTKLKDARPPERIVEDIRRHFESKPIFSDLDEIFERFLHAFAQDPMLDDAAVEYDEDKD